MAHRVLGPQRKCTSLGDRSSLATKEAFLPSVLPTTQSAFLQGAGGRLLPCSQLLTASLGGSTAPPAHRSCIGRDMFLGQKKET